MTLVSRFFRLPYGMILAALIAGCAATGPNGINDPYEGVNRTTHEFNKSLDSAILRPAAVGYAAVTPTLFQHMLGNALDTLAQPNDIVNNALQGDIEGVLQSAGRLGVNVLLGAGGLLDPATEFGLPRKRSDFGMTLASYGVDEGAYVEIPFFGPSTERDAVGRAVDVFLDPVSYALAGTAISRYLVGETAVRAIYGRDEHKEAVDQAFYESEDSYVTTRSVFLQLRRSQIAGETTEESLPDVFAE